MKQLMKLVGGDNYDELYVEAEIVGQLGLHNSMDSEGYEGDIIVSHVKSGCFIAVFEDFEDALDFAQKAITMIDFDAYLNTLVSIGIDAAKAAFGDQIDAVKQLRWDYESDVSDLVESEIATEDYLKARVQP